MRISQFIKANSLFKNRFHLFLHENSMEEKESTIDNKEKR